MITISKTAQKHFVLLLSKEPIGTQIRFFITNPGTQFAECGVAYCSENEIEQSDIQLKYNQFYVYVNKSIISYLKNVEIDLITDKISSQLTLKAPYAKQNISNKFSILEHKVQHFLNVEINPQLSTHGGKVYLVKITSEKIAILKFTGGCNGCSMIGSTLKSLVEKKILEFFSEIKKVHDETNHLHGNHSFY